MYLDYSLPSIAAAALAPRCAFWKLCYPSLVSFGLLAALSSPRIRHVSRHIDVILDVGANIGQYAYMASKVWPTIPVFSVEPDPVSFGILERNRSRFDIRGKAFQFGLGDSTGERVLKVQEDSAQNSFRNKVSVAGGGIREVMVPCLTLDEFSLMLPEFANAWLKIDAQGSELEVIRGAVGALRRFAFVQLEVAFVPSYSGQHTAEVLIAEMHGHGYHCIDILDVLRDRTKISAPIVEADFLFAREG